MDQFADWCKASCLLLNTKKTKELIIDFSTGSHTHQNMAINGEDIEVVMNYKYLGTMIDNKLTWTCNTDAIYKKGMQRLYFMRKLRQFRVDRDMMRLFYHSFVESILCFCSVAWYFSLSVVNKNKLHKIINMASKIACQPLNSMAMTVERRVANKAYTICDDVSHPLHQTYELLPSGRRFRLPLFQTNRARKSFIPSSIALLNKDPTVRLFHNTV